MLVAQSSSSTAQLDTELHRRNARRGWRLPCRALSAAVGVLEWFAFLGGCAAGGGTYAVFSEHPTDPTFVALYGVVGGLAHVALLRGSGLYRIPALLTASAAFGRVVVACASLTLSLTAALFFLKIGSGVSRGTVLTSAIFIVPLCCLSRMLAAQLVARLMTRGFVAGDPFYLIGDQSELATLSDDYLLRQFGVTALGRSALAREDYATGLCAVGDAIERARWFRARGLLIVLDAENLGRIEHVTRSLAPTPLPAHLLPNRILRGVAERYADPASVHLTTLQRAPLSAIERAGKRLADICGATLGLVATFPILACAAVAVKLDSPGPVIFRQRRSGFDQHAFWIFKFRTMTVQEDGDTIVQAVKGDQRITRVGRFLRRSSIDELPQLFNVLRGEMSLVGPRPHALAHDRQFASAVDDYFYRHHVKPGITGWAQVNGSRGELPAHSLIKRRVEFDLWYINNWSLWLDVTILARTAVSLFGGAAY